MSAAHPGKAASCQVITASCQVNVVFSLSRLLISSAFAISSTLSGLWQISPQSILSGEFGPECRATVRTYDDLYLLGRISDPCVRYHGILEDLLFVVQKPAHSAHGCRLCTLQIEVPIKDCAEYVSVRLTENLITLMWIFAMEKPSTAYSIEDLVKAIGHVETLHVGVRISYLDQSRTLIRGR